MSKSQFISNWAAERGEKWRAHLDGMEAMLRPIDEPLIRALKLDAPYRIADIGCGGGGTTFELVRRAPRGSLVHGYDIAPPLIEIARERALLSGAPVAFTLADVEIAAVPDERYDRLVSRLGIMFFGDPLAAFANLFSWLRPEARFAFAVWGRPSENPWETYARRIVSEIADLPLQADDAPGPFRYGQVDTLVSLLSQAGFREVHIGMWRGELAIGGGLAAEEAATFALDSFSSFSEALKEAGPGARERARQSLIAQFLRHETEGNVRIDACAHLVTGVRPA